MELLYTLTHSQGVTRVISRCINIIFCLLLFRVLQPMLLCSVLSILNCLAANVVVSLCCPFLIVFVLCLAANVAVSWGCPFLFVFVLCLAANVAVSWGCPFLIVFVLCLAVNVAVAWGCPFLIVFVLCLTLNVAVFHVLAILDCPYCLSSGH
jgi:hypothetical protein